MDTLTHALSGALFARATAACDTEPGAIPCWQRIAVGAAAAAFPDVDFVASFVSPLFWILHHRGVTHSIVLLPAWALLLAWLAALVLRHPRGWRAYYAVAALGLGTHIAGDLITSFGTMIFAPLSDVRIAWGTAFIIDLWFSGMIVAGLALSAAWKRSSAPALIASAALVGYVAFQGLLHAQAVEFGTQHARAEGIAGAKVSVQPGPASPFNWVVVLEKDGEYRYALVNLLRREIAAEAGPESGFLAHLSAPFNPVSEALWSRASLFGYIPEDASLAREAWNQAEFGFFRWFAQYPALYRVDRGNPSLCVWFRDLRFSRPGAANTSFRYGMCHEPAQSWRRYQIIGDDARVALD
ncbi:MAG: metal-dependent hydrolase [Pseudomonadota bacterium]